MKPSLALVASFTAVLSAWASPVRARPPARYADLIRRVVAARGLDYKTPVLVIELNDAAYGDAASRLDHRPPSTSSRAFLNPKNGVVYTRGAKDEEIAELLVRALQNQHFSLEQRLVGLGTREAADALEGFAIADANLVQLLLTDPSTRELATHVARLSTMTPEKAVAARRIDPAILSEPEIEIRKVMMKQCRSLALVTRLYLLGGWPLVNRAWQHPPTQLAHLSDPKSYVDGSREPALLPAIPDIRGDATVEDAVSLSAPQAYGFFLALLSTAGTSTKDPFTATLYAEAQRGMSVRIVTRPGYGRAFVLVSAWESPQAAERARVRWLESKTIASDCGPIARVREHALVATLCVGAAASDALIAELLPKIGPLPVAAAPLGPLALPKLEDVH